MNKAVHQRWTIGIPTIVVSVALEPCWPDIFDAESLQFESCDIAAFIRRIRSVCRHAIDVRWKTLRLTISVQLSKISIEGAILLQHEDHVIDCRNVPARSARRSINQAANTPGHKRQNAACTQQKWKLPVHQAPDASIELR